MKYIIKSTILIISFLFCNHIFSQSLITSNFYQTDTICEGTSGKVRLYMYNSNMDQSVSNLRLYFHFDSTVLKITNVIPTTIFSHSQMTVTYPTSGRCDIIDTLSSPNNFYYEDPDTKRNIAFDIEFTGLKEAVTFINFIPDSCYFKTEDDEIIPSIFLNSPAIRIKPGRLTMNFEQTGIGCSYETKGAMIVSLSEGVEPYKYKWDRGKTFANMPNMTGELEGGELQLTVTDGNGCLHDTTVNVEILKAPEIDWDYSPQPAVIEYPITFEVTEFDNAYNWLWKIYTPEQDSIELGDNKNLTSFTQVFLVEGAYEVLLSAQSMETGCDTTIQKTVDVSVAELEYKNLITPNGNRFRIVNKNNTDLTLQDTYLSHVVSIYDRNGRKVYETDNFPADGWNGDKCPNGTYFFVLKARSTRKEYVYKGSLVILGGNQ